jgi:hypothetical protein
VQAVPGVYLVTQVFHGSDGGTGLWPGRPRVGGKIVVTNSEWPAEHWPARPLEPQVWALMRDPRARAFLPWTTSCSLQMAVCLCEKHRCNSL